MGYYLVRETHGPAWDPARHRREQKGWEEHAAFVDGMSEDGLVVLGGPVGEDTDQDVVLVFDADSEEAIRARLADDPWTDTILAIASVEPWSVWVRSGA
jgi:uncharacterized protein YciI